MAQPRSDKEIVAVLTAKLGGEPPVVEYDKQGRVIALNLSGRALTSVPDEVIQFTHLRALFLSHNQLSAVPDTLGQLSQLRQLSLNHNQLSAVPDTFGQLSQLRQLSLRYNQLSAVPDTFGQLSQLQELYLHHNQLSTVPDTLGQLSQLRRLSLDGNENLMIPPPEIVPQGTQAILAFLRELQRDSTVRYESKLLVLGEGGTGKSSLLRALQGQVFVQGLNSTHGIEVGSYALPHPDDPAVTLTLNTWDFGGQEIYHATHQFFLTRRSLYLVVWNARLGVEQGRLDYWLKTIQVLAPGAPILLVATHTDERAADINIQLYQVTYPQIVASFAVSNLSRAGLDTLKAALAERAARLPLMGQRWPSSWLADGALRPELSDRGRRAGRPPDAQPGAAIAAIPAADRAAGVA